MTGVLSGLRVLDLSWGVAGPMTTMLLADHGADVVKIEPPGGDPFREIGRCALGYKTWQRGKRSAILDLKDPADREAFVTLARHADMLVESFQPGVADRLGVGYSALSELNPRLIYLSITAYGRDTPDARRSGFDMLVGARSGLSWEHRGWPEGCILHMAGGQDPLADLEVPYERLQGPPRPGPVATAAPAPSLGAFYSAFVAINAALFAREITGRGQRVETSLMQGAILAGVTVWQRAEQVDTDGFNTWIYGSKSPKGHFRCKDGRWVNAWVPNPRFIIQASEGDQIDASPDLSVHSDPNRFGTGVEETLVIDYYHPILSERFARFDCDDWLAAAAAADVPMQEVRAPEAALVDPLFLADGCVRELEDPDLGPIRQVGVVIDMEKSPGRPGGPAPRAGQHTHEIIGEAAALQARPSAKPGAEKRRLSAPLAGVRVLDLGLAIAGPFGAQVLADLGADVVKVNAFHDSYWHRNHVAFAANRGKRSVCLDLKSPRGMEVLRRLVQTADVVHHNMRYAAAVRLGVDYESLKAIKPDLIYCHTRGHERGPREGVAGNEQTGACLAGVQYEDGGMADGGKPFWSLTGFGDTGNGLLSAAAVAQALYHRARTGEGQFVGTSIVNAQLLNMSYVSARPDGGAFERPLLDGMQTGLWALNSFYETAAGWIAVAAVTEAHWAALKRALNTSSLDASAFAIHEGRRTNDKALRSALAAIFRTRAAADWIETLDREGAPAEVSDPDVGGRLHDDPVLRARRWTRELPHPIVGRFQQSGLCFDFSETPGVVDRSPLVVGDSTREVLLELGYSEEEIEKLSRDKVVGLWSPGEPPIAGARRFIGYKPEAAATA